MEESKEDSVVTGAREHLASVEAKRADGLQVFRAASAGLRSANEALNAARNAYCVASESAKTAREELDDIESQLVSAFKALLEAERR